MFRLILGLLSCLFLLPACDRSKSSTSCQEIEPEERSKQADSRLILQNKRVVKECGVVIDCLEEAADLMACLIDFSSTNDVDFLLRKKINEFVYIESRLNKTAGQLNKMKCANDYNSGQFCSEIKKMRKIANKMIFCCREYIDLLVAFDENPMSLNLAVIRSRVMAVFVECRNDLLELTAKFCSRHKQWLTDEDIKCLRQRIYMRYSRDIDLFTQTIREAGAESAFRLPFESGAWFPIYFYIHLD